MVHVVRKGGSGLTVQDPLPLLPTCSLCLGEHRQCSTPSSWKVDEARSFVHRLKISANESACRREVIDDSSYKLRWEKPVREYHCFVDLCTDSVFVSLYKVSSAQLCESFKTAGLKCSSLNFPTPLPLCKHHYHTVYKIAKPTVAHCSLCGLSLKHTATKYCPNPKAVEHHLRENSGFDGHISETDQICYTCYRAHLVILQQNEAVSFDFDLEEVLCSFSEQHPASISIVSRGQSFGGGTSGN